MKKYFWMLMGLTLCLVSCGKSKEEQVKEFAVDFAEKASENQIDSLKAVYPDIEKADSVALKYIAEGIVVHPSGEGKEYKVLLNPDVSIIVKPTEDGSFSVTESRGLFAYPRNVIEIVEQEGLWKNDITDLDRVKLVEEAMVKRKNFTSPDLSFFNVRGPVKEMTISFNGDISKLPFVYFCPVNKKYVFNENGEWLNLKQIYPDSKGIKRNSNGEIKSILFPDEYNPGEVEVWSYTWDNGKPIKSVSMALNEFYEYNEEGFLRAFKSKESFSEVTNNISVSFSNFICDEYGNWISCNWEGSSFYDEGGDIRRDKKQGTLTRSFQYY